MLVYLDTVICIYAVEGAPTFKARAKERLLTLRTACDRPAISDLTWLEARLKPVRLGDAAALADMEAFLTASDVVKVPLPPAVYERAFEYGLSRISNWLTLCISRLRWRAAAACS